MSRCLLTIVSALAISGSLLTFDRAEAGASASAPSKYSNAKVASASQTRTTRHGRSTDYAITEYSSSSARNPAPKH
jgi:hypothetical protein